MIDQTKILCAKEKLNIITSIGYDHLDYLGNTIEKITKDKSGIFLFWLVYQENFCVRNPPGQKLFGKKFNGQEADDAISACRRNRMRVIQKMGGPWFQGESSHVIGEAFFYTVRR